MKCFLALLFIVASALCTWSQGGLPQLLGTESGFVTAAEKEMKSAFLEYLAPDAILFRPQAVNGREYWSAKSGSTGEVLVRKTIFADIASNGLLGYTTGNWRQFKRGKSESDAVYGQYVTVWEKKPTGGYRAV